jgi:hypothetical protein
LLIYFKLARAGYGSVNEIEKWDARKVLQAIHYEKFCNEYEAAYFELNRR